jgi:hypothetical protein
MRALTVAAVLLAVLIDGFFALINFYPVAPPRARGPKRRIVMTLDAAQARWLRDNLIDEFNRAHNSDVELITVDEAQLLPTLAGARDDLVLASLPRPLARQAVAQKLVRPLGDAAQVKRDFDALVPTATNAMLVDGKQQFLPSHALVDVLVFRISRVRDAVRHWSLLRNDIDAALRAANGRGLPPNYKLELEPEQWDGFDRFVIGYYWARRRYGQKPAQGRVAHRNGESLDGAIDIVEGLYRAGVNDETLAKPDAAPVRDYFSWERLYRQHGLFAPSMLAQKPLDDAALMDGLKSGELFLATVDTMQAFTLHGGSQAGAVPGVADPDDLGFAPLPRISSLELGKSGAPARPGEPFSFREDWVWTLPAHAADAELAYELASFLWDRENHIRLCEALGAIPLRADVQRERSSLFRLTWMDDVFDAAFAEWTRSQPVPDGVAAGWGSRYAQLWDRVVRNGEPLDVALHTPPPPRPLAAPPVALTGPIVDDHLPTEDEVEDRLDDIDEELWNGKVELDNGAHK